MDYLTGGPQGRWILGMAWALGLPADSSEILIARLSAMTPAQVQSVAQRYFGDDELTVGTLVPQKRK